jgi:hypothetical protein
MRAHVGLAILATAGVVVVCLLVGVGSGPDCAAGMAPAACLGGSVGSIRDLFGVAAAMGATVGGFLAVSILWQVRRHRRLSVLLDRAASPAWLADHEVGLVPGLAAPCVAGLARPRIYCPADLAERLSEPELRAVVLHERHHQLVHAPARLVVLAALAPALGRIEVGRRWVERRRAAIEITADEHALGAGASRSELARALFKFGSASLSAGLPSYASASELRLRHLIGEASPPHQGLGSLAPLVVPVGAFVACLALGLIA